MDSLSPPSPNISPTRPLQDDLQKKLKRERKKTGRFWNKKNLRKKTKERSQMREKNWRHPSRFNRNGKR